MFSNLKRWIVKKAYGSLLELDASSSSRDPEASTVKKIGLRQGDVANKDFEDPEFDLGQIALGYAADSYIKQGCDKHVDQIFKEGYDFYSKNVQAAEYIKLRLAFIAEATKTPTEDLFIEIAEDTVKFANCFVAKARANDVNMLPPGVTVAGLSGKDPVVGYFPINATTIKLRRDKVGTILGYQQETPDSDKPVKFKAEDMIHFFTKREKGNAFGTPFLWPVLDDVRALRQMEENVVETVYRNIHPFYHVRVGTDAAPGTDPEILGLQSTMDSMELNGGLATSSRVEMRAIASDQVIDAEPYLAYLENRVFTGLGVPGILFGRGGTANRSTGDNMTSEMLDRVKAIQRVVENTVNHEIIKELLLEGGFDPILNPDDMVEFRFKENNLDALIKNQNQAVFLFEHNAITEDEMRFLLNMDPIADADRVKLNREISLQSQLELQASKPAPGDKSNAPTGKGSKEANNKSKPTNQHGTKTAPKKSKDYDYAKMLTAIDSLLKEEK